MMKFLVNIAIAAVMLCTTTSCLTSSARDKIRDRLRNEGYIKSGSVYQKLVPGAYYEKVNPDGSVEVVEGPTRLEETTVGKELGWLKTVLYGAGDATILASVAGLAGWGLSEIGDEINDSGGDNITNNITGNNNQVNSGGGDNNNTPDNKDDEEEVEE